MQFINNGWEVVVRSAASWVGFILGNAMIFYAYVNSSSDAVKLTFHFASWGEWVPWAAGLAVAFGIPLARSIKQNSVTQAVNKP